jgi:hypothetical protein
MNVIKNSHKWFVIVTYEIWCDLHDLSKMACFGLAVFMKPNFAKKSNCHV